MTDSLLRFDDVTITYPDGTTPVWGVSFDVTAGTVHALVGPSGVGKTTLLSAATGTLPPGTHLSGAITMTVDGQPLNVAEFSPAQWRHHRTHTLGYLPQHAGSVLNPTRTVWAHARGLTRDRDRITATFTRHGFPEALLRRYPWQLSGGQVRRAVNALGHLLDPALVIADEPTTGLDPHTFDATLAALRPTGPGRAVLVSTHDARVMSAATDLTDLTKAVM